MARASGGEEKANGTGKEGERERDRGEVDTLDKEGLLNMSEVQYDEEPIEPSHEHLVIWPPHNTIPTHTRATSLIQSRLYQPKFEVPLNETTAMSHSDSGRASGKTHRIHATRIRLQSNSVEPSQTHPD